MNCGCIYWMDSICNLHKWKIGLKWTALILFWYNNMPLSIVQCIWTLVHSVVLACAIGTISVMLLFFCVCALFFFNNQHFFFICHKYETFFFGVHREWWKCVHFELSIKIYNPFECNEFLLLNRILAALLADHIFFPLIWFFCGVIFPILQRFKIHFTPFLVWCSLQSTLCSRVPQKKNRRIKKMCV